MQRFLDALRHNRVSNIELLTAVVALAALLLLLIFRSHWQQVLAKTARQRRDRRDFLELCRNRGLARDEIGLLVHYVQAFGQALEPVLAQSNAAFDRFARRIISEANSPEIPRLNHVLSRAREKLGFRPLARGLALSSSRELSPGQRLYLVFSSEQFLEGIVSDVDETKLDVHLLTPGAARLPKATSDPVRVYFSRAADARYSGMGYILKAYSNGDGMFVTLSHLEELKRDQRRQEFRVEENRLAKLWVLHPVDDSAVATERLLESRMPEDATLEDLSGGGASLIFPRELPLNQQIYLDLDPAGLHGLPLVRGSVIRSQRRSGRSNWALSVRFEDLRPSERQRLVHHVFLQERELIRAM